MVNIPASLHLPRWRTLTLLAVLLAPLLLPLHYMAERYYREQLAEQNRQTLDLYVANLLGTLGRYEVLPDMLGDMPALRASLADPADPASQAAANQLLERIRQRSGADVIYLMRADGYSQAASNWQQADSFIGQDFSFRPYFQEAMQDRPGRFFGLGTTSRKRGYYFAAPVRDGQEIIGVVVVKVDLDEPEKLWGNTPEQLLVTDSFGVVILTSNDEWRFRASQPISAAQQAVIARNLPYPPGSLKPLTISGKEWLIQERTLDTIGWTARILAPRELLERQVRTVLYVGGASLLALLLLLAVMTLRRRHYLERIALDARAKRDLELNVQERTQDLQTLNQRLQQEVHEREQAQRELMRAQDEVVQAGKLSALGTMSASISHELNQPLAAIRSYAENAATLLDHNRIDDARGNLKLIGELTTRMANIISHLKAYARGARRAPESVVLQDALEDALSLLAARRRGMNVELIRDVPDAPLWVQAGETRLRQIINNLLTNALDALIEKGPPRRLWLIASQDEKGVTLILRDNGPGFSAEALARAHEPFFTTKATTQGLGLGLAICDTLLRALGGHLHLSNHHEGGAEVRLHLQRGKPGVAPVPQEEMRG
ncbi:two-component system C4-dicarboxylate transport sensor histidine kinase DctB [Pseudomonas duriflava]|uniref:C4-dicarboxylate transport sensor protein DctB n=1 Tax=Pseudomonas duriflava TaxID=459528 RepID=A0A562PXX6_9PSED|nr:sensor histidine kinase [Pseudomonas duriflava]TWI49291.1 two-component system C4-dicarboxylate transport sensor histidine kinase DctB [Pseudomonas duriflava]